MIKISRKKLTIAIWKSIKFLPKGIRGVLSRSLFQVNLKSEKDNKDKIIFKIASDTDEIISALRLIQENYQRLKMTDSDDLIRASKFNLLPTTAVFVAKCGEEVVGTISVIVDSSLGLPIDDFSDISSYREDGRVVEIGSFCIKESWRSRNSGISVPLALFSLKYCFEKVDTDFVVLTVRSSVALFYEDICCFKPFGERKKHSGVQGLKSASLVVEAKTYLRDLELIYSKRRLEKNLFLLYSEFPWSSQDEFFKEKFGLISQKIMLDKKIVEALEGQASFFHHLNVSDKLVITNFTNDMSLYKKFMKDAKEHFSTREDFRFHVNIKGRSIVLDTICDIKLLDVSRSGIRIICNSDLPKNIIIKFVIPKIGPILLVCETKWSKKKQYGLRIINESSSWNRLIDYYESMIVEESKNAA